MNYKNKQMEREIACNMLGKLYAYGRYAETLKSKQTICRYKYRTVPVPRWCSQTWLSYKATYRYSTGRQEIVLLQFTYNA